MKIVRIIMYCVFASVIIWTCVSLGRARGTIDSIYEDTDRKMALESVKMGIVNIDTYRLTRDYAKARAVFERSISRLSTISGNNDLYYGMCYGKIALVDVNEGVPGYGRQRYDMAVKLLGEKHKELRDGIKSEYAKELTNIGRSDLIPTP